MASGANLAADVSGYVQTIYEMAELARRDTDFMSSLVKTFPDGYEGTAARSRSEYGTVNYQQITDADDLNSQTFTPTVAQTITPAFFGAQFFITDRRYRTTPVEQQGDAARELGQGAGKHVQLALLNQFSSFTGGTVGSAGGTITWGNLFAAVTKVRQQNAEGELYGVLQEGHWYHLGTVTVPAGAQTNGIDIQNEVARRYWVGNFFNVDWFVTNDIPSGTAAVGGVFTREALAYDDRKLFGIEYQRDASRGGGGFELNATMEYAKGVWRPSSGCAIVATSVVP